ncbi:DUF2867 domain-containing protein [Nakamurella flava]|uniref:DUF2867 domain-containing protein n=1 Tax=Nakamurella flava TaxID=2576308 RepID=A0A4V6CS90_9ACTN|nr:DUF2867 domain-containing protein [Nakamurella flava]TKV60685.1 DUF2867 domain-containing protein [Nakamurella flava]
MVEPGGRHRLDGRGDQGVLFADRGVEPQLADPTGGHPGDEGPHRGGRVVRGVPRSTGLGDDVVGAVRGPPVEDGGEQVVPVGEVPVERPLGVPVDRRAVIPADPAELEARVFDVRALPRAVRALFTLRQRLVRLLGIPPAPPDIFRVSQVSGGEALIAAPDQHLDFCAGVSAPGGVQVRVDTRVRLHGWRGRVYLLPVRLVHPMIVRAMVRSAIERD